MINNSIFHEISQTNKMISLIQKFTLGHQNSSDRRNLTGFSVISIKFHARSSDVIPSNSRTLTEFCIISFTKSFICTYSSILPLKCNNFINTHSIRTFIRLKQIYPKNQSSRCSQFRLTKQNLIPTHERSSFRHTKYYYVKRLYLFRQTEQHFSDTWSNEQKFSLL